MYAQGKNRLFYQSRNDDLQNVVITIIRPNLDTLGPWPMCFIGDGLYYIDIWFRYLGSYVFKVYENDVKTHQDILVVSRYEHIIYPDMKRLV